MVAWQGSQNTHQFPFWDFGVSGGGFPRGGHFAVFLLGLGGELSYKHAFFSLTFPTVKIPRCHPLINLSTHAILDFILFFYFFIFFLGGSSGGAAAAWGRDLNWDM